MVFSRRAAPVAQQHRLISKIADLGVAARPKTVAARVISLQLSNKAPCFSHGVYPAFPVFCQWRVADRLISEGFGEP